MFRYIPLYWPQSDPPSGFVSPNVLIVSTCSIVSTNSLYWTIGLDSRSPWTMWRCHSERHVNASSTGIHPWRVNHFELKAKKKQIKIFIKKIRQHATHSTAIGLTFPWIIHQTVIQSFCMRTVLVARFIRIENFLNRRSYFFHCWLVFVFEFTLKWSVLLFHLKSKSIGHNLQTELLSKTQLKIHVQKLIASRYTKISTSGGSLWLMIG